MSPNERERIPLGVHRKKETEAERYSKNKSREGQRASCFLHSEFTLAGLNRSEEVKEPLHQPQVCLLASALFDYEQRSK